jgi:hypothetical protein
MPILYCNWLTAIRFSLERLQDKALDPAAALSVEVIAYPPHIEIKDSAQS